MITCPQKVPANVIRILSYPDHMPMRYDRELAYANDKINLKIRHGDDKLFEYKPGSVAVALAKARRM